MQLLSQGLGAGTHPIMGNQENGKLYGNLGHKGVWYGDDCKNYGPRLPD